MVMKVHFMVRLFYDMGQILVRFLDKIGLSWSDFCALWSDFLIPHTVLPFFMRVRGLEDSQIMVKYPPLTIKIK